MATNRWQPTASPVAQVSTTTVGAYDVTTTYNVIINGKTVGVLGQGGTATTTATALAAALNAISQALFPEFTEMVWSSLSAVVTATGKKAGVPFVFTTSVSGGTGTIGAFTAVVAATGPWNWDNAANWSLGAVPVNTNDVYSDLNSGPILYGLGQSAVTLNSLNFAGTATGQVGLPEINTSGSTPYREYRQRYLAIGVNPGVTNIGYGGGAGSGLTYIDFGSVQANIIVSQSATPIVQGTEPIQLKGTHVSNVLSVSQGVVAFCGQGSDVGALATLNVGYITNPATDSQVRIGPGCTPGAINLDGGVADVFVASTGILIKGGGVLTVHSGALTAPDVENGTLYYLGGGATSSPVIGNNGVLDFTQNPQARTITGTMQLYKGYVFNDPFSTCGSYNVHFNHCSDNDGVMNNGIGHTYAVS